MWQYNVSKSGNVCNFTSLSFIIYSISEQFSKSMFHRKQNNNENKENIDKNDTEISEKQTRNMKETKTAKETQNVKDLPSSQQDKNSEVSQISNI